MQSTPREIGTLIVIIAKANHLPDKRNFGKQDPYCTVVFNGEKQRTEVVKRGGQRPVWDEEFRFKIYEYDTKVVSNVQDGPPPPPPKDSGKMGIRGGTIMKLSCYADATREPSLIGQADVDLTEVLTTGETDEWFTLMKKDKFAGEVYLELTFWSNETPPEKKVAPVPVPKGNREGSGPGSFISSDDTRAVPGSGFPSLRVVSTSSVYNRSRRQSDSGATALRSSNSQLELYRPAYEQEHPSRRRVASFSASIHDFGELSMDPSRRRESLLPPPSTIHNGRPPSSEGFSGATYPPSHGHELFMHETASSMHPYNRPLPDPYAQYDPQNDSGSTYNPPPSRGPRYSLPSQPSGFRRLSNSSSFVPLPSDPFEPLGFGLPLSHTPAPSAHYAPSQIKQPQSYAPVVSQTPDSGYAPPFPPLASASFHPQQAFPPSHSFQHSQFQPQPLPPEYNPPPPTHMPTPSGPQVEGYPLPLSPLSHSPASSSSSAGPGSRPLPQQPQFHAAQQYSLPHLPHQGAYNPGSRSQDNYQSPPPLHQTRGLQSYDLQGSTNPNPAYQSLSPPPSHSNIASPRRRSSLPTPPTQLQQANYPPPPPLEYLAHNPLPPPPPLPSHAQSYYHGSPAAQIDGPAQWTQPPQNSHTLHGWS
ncbi:hypothetical protein B0H19DRAFT_1378151 [Mycena capillaripes]|nr:hypothetical protein B0H19DRAFT_1378151 [Mycena capillaripes]